MNEEKNIITKKMKCSDIHTHLFSYITHDTGQSRTELIKNHLADCINCQAEAKQIKEALDFLNGTYETKNIPTQLSDKHRALIARSFMHPILDFIYRHHIIISIITALITIAITLCVLRQVKVWHSEKLESGISVSLGNEA